MIRLTGRDGGPLWVSPMHVTLVSPVSDEITEITLDCGTVVTVAGKAHDIAAMVAADLVQSADGATHSAHPLEMD